MKRSDLPERTYTIDPDGKIHLLINGRAVLHISTIRIAGPKDGDSIVGYPVLEVRIPISEPYLRFVPWETLGEIAAAEDAAKAAAEA